MRAACQQGGRCATGNRAQDPLLHCRGIELMRTGYDSSISEQSGQTDVQVLERRSGLVGGVRPSRLIFSHSVVREMPKQFAVFAMPAVCSERAHDLGALPRRALRSALRAEAILGSLPRPRSGNRSAGMIQAVSECHGPFDAIAKLANVAGPWVSYRRLLG